MSEHQLRWCAIVFLSIAVVLLILPLLTAIYTALFT